ncbi:DUF2802 domain-containing protein [uncultured Ferrimonas sp.]|uniref:DUF2802 domain-containing protein n=1 Tax=uncultured Ferrimonas sp. TaxID=432640 RepID=UPI0026173C70|nr:DUF2802 domain-containing protein [uncultured Ferrimonas sp.]
MTELMVIAGIAMAVLIVAAGMLVRWIRAKVNQVERKVEAVKLLLKAAEANNEALQRELTEVRSGALGVGKRVKELEHSQQHLQARQDEVLQTDPDAKLYNRAMKMVELGADVEEIMKDCELPKAEAQLLVTLHRRGQ